MPRRSPIARRSLRLESLESRQMLSGTTVVVSPQATSNAEGNGPTAATAAASTPVLAYTETVGRQAIGSLSGKIVYTSGGHGYTADNLGNGSWGFQRPELFDMIEDLGNQDQMTMYVDYLFRAGATVVPLRPVGHQTNEVVLDNDDPEVTWTGSWSNSSNSVYYGSAGDVPYRFTAASSTETATARYRPNIPEPGNYPVYTWALASSNRVTNQLYTVHHAGGDTQVTINHQAVGGGYVYLGTYYFEAGNEGYVEISNQSNESGYIIADSIRFGNGMGDIDRGGGISGRAREDEPALYWIMAQAGQGTPEETYQEFASDRTSTIRAPILWAAHMNQESTLDAIDRVYLGFHTNASSGTARGAMALYNNGSEANTATPHQYAWAELLSDELTEDMQSTGSPPLEYPWSTANRAPYGNSYGEIDNRVINNEFDASIIEVAFHDNQTDARLLLDPDVRDLTARACYQATVEYFNTFDAGTDSTLLPDPVSNIAATVNADGTITVQWDAPAITSAGGDAPTGYLIYKSTDGTGYDGGTYIDASTGTSVIFNNLPNNNGVYYFRVAACNDGGVSKPSEVVVASPSGTSGDRILIVNGFDRQDRFLIPNDPFGSGTVSRVRPESSNSYAYATQVGQALGISADKIAISSVQNEAVIQGEVDLSDYQMVVWILGEESTADDTFDATEQAKVTDYLAHGGNLFVSGAEIGYELRSTNFYLEVLHSVYVRDDAATYTAQGSANGIFAGINLTFDDGTTFYDTNYPDVITPGIGAQAALAYTGGTGGTAAIQYEGVGDEGNIVMLGFPFETITSPSVRESMMASVLEFFELGNPRLPGDANQDGRVDGSDVTIVANNWQLGVTGTTRATWAQGDFNADGRVDGSDVTILANNWQSGINSTVVAVSGDEEETDEITDDTETEPSENGSTATPSHQVPRILTPVSYEITCGPRRKEESPVRRQLTPTLHDAVLTDLPE